MHDSHGRMRPYRKQWQLYNLPKFLNLLFAPADIRVGHVWLLLDLHHGYRGIDLWREGNLDLILIAINTVGTNGWLERALL